MPTPSNESPHPPNPAASANLNDAASATTAASTPPTSSTVANASPLPELSDSEKIELLRSMILMQEAEFRRLQMKVDVIGGAVKELHQIVKQLTRR